jgi:hypothetical protein
MTWLAGAMLALGLALAGGARADDARRWGVAFATSETAATTRHAGVGAKVSLAGDIDRAGPLVMATAGTGGVALLGGWQAQVGRALVVGLAGPEHRAGRGLGLRLHGEVWAHPTPASTAALVVSCGTSERHCWSRARLGLPLLGVQLGPEGVWATDRAALGVATTGVRLMGMDVEVAVGVARSRRGEIGPYGTLALVRRF